MLGLSCALMLPSNNPTRADDKPNHKVEIIAHRGESYDAPENTLASFNLAWKRGGADACELDIHLTSDGKLIVIHDPDTFRVTRIHTRRNAADFPDDCPNPQKLPCGVQDLNYTFDPAGNVTHVRDDARNVEASPAAECIGMAQDREIVHGDNRRQAWSHRAVVGRAVEKVCPVEFANPANPCGFQTCLRNPTCREREWRPDWVCAAQSRFPSS